MNRREALAALVSLPSVTRIQSVPANADDVIVVEVDHAISIETQERIKAHLQKVWPDRKIVVLDKSIQIKLVPK
jgi:hypothetical protein